MIKDSSYGNVCKLKVGQQRMSKNRQFSITFHSFLSLIYFFGLKEGNKSAFVLERSGNSKVPALTKKT